MNKKNGDNSSEKAEFSNRGGKKYKSYQKGREKFDKRKTQCFNSIRFGHFADE